MTHRQRKAMEIMVEKGGSVSRAMISAGYSPNTAKTPSKLTRSKSWSELTELYLPDEYLLYRLVVELESGTSNKKQLLELAFRLKGRMSNSSTENIDNFSELIASQRKKYLI